jgi:hypothetical protein
MMFLAGDLNISQSEFLNERQISENDTIVGAWCLKHVRRWRMFMVKDVGGWLNILATCMVTPDIFFRNVDAG